MRTQRTPFDFTRAMNALCRDIVHRVDELGHIRMDHVAVTFAQARTRVGHGMQAKLTPLRLESGALTTQQGGRTWTVQRLFDGDREMLYMLTFYLPRFMNQAFREKMITVFHELYHISPQFNGDLRRLNGRCYMHSESEKAYDQYMAVLADCYLAQSPPKHLYAFLRHKFRTLEQRFGGVVGMNAPIPKMLLVPERNEATPESLSERDHERLLDESLALGIGN